MSAVSHDRYAVQFAGGRGTRALFAGGSVLDFPAVRAGSHALCVGGTEGCAACAVDAVYVGGRGG